MDKTQLACLNVSVVFCSIIYSTLYVRLCSISCLKSETANMQRCSADTISLNAGGHRLRQRRMARPWHRSCKRLGLGLISSQDMPEVAAVLSDTTREASE